MKAATASALVLFSGGQDSTTCLASALSRFGHVETIGFDYGQRHSIELECRLNVLARMRSQFPIWAQRLGEDIVLELGLFKTISDTALIRDVAIEIGESGLLTTFVPGRNILFLAAAAAVAYRRGHEIIVGGMCETDFSGYPDCRDDTIKALQVALNLGMDKRFCTGGEPLLQVDCALTEALHARNFEIAIETNGMVAAPEGLDWICVSPKAGSAVVQRNGDELKLVFPQSGTEPSQFEDWDFKHFFLQPMDGPQRVDNTTLAIQYCLQHPRWRLSPQTHKLVGIPKHKSQKPDNRDRKVAV